MEVHLGIQLEFEQNSLSDEAVEFEQTRPATIIKQPKEKLSEGIDFLFNRLENLPSDIGLGQKEVSFKPDLEIRSDSLYQYFFNKSSKSELDCMDWV